MPSHAKALTAKAIEKLKTPGTKAVGGEPGLCIAISNSGRKRWILRYTSPTGKRSEKSLGPYASSGVGGLDLAGARSKARQMRGELLSGIDPAHTVAKSMTFEDALHQYSKTKLAEFRNVKYRGQWLASLEAHVLPTLGNMPVDEIDVQDVLRALSPIWQDIPVLAKKIQGRIENVLAWATVHGHREGDNPARWQGNLALALPSPGKIRKANNRAALKVADAPRWFAAVGNRQGMAAQAALFTALTAARNGETRGATWDEIDSDVWVIPAERMKMSRPHRVPLSAQALALLEALPRECGNPYLFWGTASRGGISENAIGNVMKKVHRADEDGFFDEDSGEPATPHGLRTTFRNWCGKQGIRRELAELALAHKFGSSVEQAYARDTLTEERRPIMQAWADYLTTVASDNVVRLRG